MAAVTVSRACARAGAQRRRAQRSVPLLAAAALACGVAARSAFVSLADPETKKGVVVERRPEHKVDAKGQDAFSNHAHHEGHAAHAAGAAAQGPSGLSLFLASVGLGGAVAAKAKHTPRASSSSGSLAMGGSTAMPWEGLSQEQVAQWLPRISLMLMALCCSTNFTLVKLLEDGHAESTVAAVRFGVALLPFLPLIPQHMNRVSIISGVEIGAWCTLGYVTQALGLPDVEASKGAFLVSLAMVVVPLAKAAFGYPVRTQTWAAVALAAFGTALLVGLGGGAATGFGAGECLCTLTAVGFGLMFARMDEHAKHPEFDAMGCTTWQVVTLAISMAVWSWWTEGTAGSFQEASAILSSGPETLATLAWVGFVTTAGVLYIETWAMEEVDGTEAGIIFASEPVWATLFASAVLGETFGPREMTGGAFILLACLLTQLRWEEKPQDAGAAA